MRSRTGYVHRSERGQNGGPPCRPVAEHNALRQSAGVLGFEWSRAPMSSLTRQLMLVPLLMNSPSPLNRHNGESARFRGATIILLALVLVPCLRAASPGWDLSQYRAQPGIVARLDQDALQVNWEGENHHELRTRFSIANGTPLLTELAVKKRGAGWNVLGRNLAPQFGVTTGVRRTGHGLPEENRWGSFRAACSSQFTAAQTCSGRK